MVDPVGSAGKVAPVETQARPEMAAQAVRGARADVVVRVNLVVATVERAATGKREVMALADQRAMMEEVGSMGPPADQAA